MKHIRILILIPLIFLLSSWGWQGHQMISSSIIDCFNDEMVEFEDWVPFITAHASDADYRKSDDPSEGPKHYIDIDSYPEFVETGRIPSTLDSCIDIHGAGFVDDNGYLPWATIDTYNSVVEYMRDGDWDNAKIAAADLGHYVADGFMPLHITINYNGQLTDNYGIHSRYESTMIGDYIDEIVFEGTPVVEIDDVSDYIFNYLYKNNQYVDDLLVADNAAKSVSGGTYNTAYYEKLWEETDDFTIELFKDASYALASLIYTAWLESGESGGTGGEQTDLIISTAENYLPEYIGVTYKEVGTIYVVPGETEKDLTAIRAASVDSTGAIADFEVKIPLTNLEPGVYWLYAKDFSGKLTGPLEFSVMHNGIQALIIDHLQVYPNPIDQHGKIGFELAKSDHILLRVMDEAGRIVSVLHDGKLSAGTHELSWQAGKSPAGMYFLLLEVQDEVFIEQLLKK